MKSSLLCSLLPTLLLVNLCVASSIQPLDKRALSNKPALDACKSLQPQSKVSYHQSSTFTEVVTRYFSSASRVPSCVFTPTTPEELSDAIKIVGKKKVKFAVSSGRHSFNPLFSSTKGVHISLKGFQGIQLSEDKKYVEVGSGNVWDNVYQALEGTGVNVIGGRVSGVGVGGMLTGGGGFSWKTNQFGLGVDTLIQADMVLPCGTLVTASASSYDDLFFAIKGGGNRFGIIYNFRLATVPQEKTIFGGLRIYMADQIPGLIKAINDFTTNNKDLKAQIIPSMSTFGGMAANTLIAYYDGPNPGTAFSAFDGLTSMSDDFKQRSFYDLVMSSPVNTTAGQRGAFHTVSLQKYSEPLLAQIANQTNYMTNQPGKSGSFKLNSCKMKLFVGLFSFYASHCINVIFLTKSEFRDSLIRLYAMPD